MNGMNRLLPMIIALALATAPADTPAAEPAPATAAPTAPTSATLESASTEATAPVDKAADDSTAAAEKTEAPIPEKIPAPDADQLAPTVSIRTGDNGDLIEEYRQDGHVTMVRIKPKNGPVYMLMDSNGDGRLDKVDGQSNGGVAPVYWTLYEWN